MSFRSPGALVLLVVIPGVVAFYLWSQRQRARRAGELAAEGLASSSKGGKSRVRRHGPFAVFAVALLALVVALGRPVMTVHTPRRQATVILAMDVSNSMLANDIKPSRFEAAKAAARAF